MNKLEPNDPGVPDIDAAGVVVAVGTVAGNPFQFVRVDAAWLRWNGGVVRTMARAICDERRFEDMPVLADALEDAGCDEQELLANCRSEGPHVRGCFFLDLLLGME